MMSDMTTTYQGVFMPSLVKQLVVLALLGQFLSAMGNTPAAAQQPQSGLPMSGPSVVIEGSSDTTIGGLPAARKRDATDGASPIADGSPNVFINGQPAATMGSRTECGGVTIGSGSNVFINGKPAARVGDMTTGCAGQ
jgi:uncharacterized Zn-binding protein involved in type VI secretion